MDVEEELDIDFDEICEDLERFQEDETVKQALHRGVDLKKYALELTNNLKEVIFCFTIEFNYIDLICFFS